MGRAKNSIQNSKLSESESKGLQAINRSVTQNHGLPNNSLRGLQRGLGNGYLQAKLTVGEPNDQYEQEADHIASQVMGMPENIIHRQMFKKEEEEKLKTKPIFSQVSPLIQRDSSKNSQVDHNFESQLNGTKNSGTPLSGEVRAFMEPRFGANFSQVRVHTGSESAQMNQEIQAQAFTHKQDIYFGSGKYDFTSHMGKELIAHELTHVLQQMESIQRAVNKNTNPSEDWEIKFNTEINNQEWNAASETLNQTEIEQILKSVKKLNSKIQAEILAVASQAKVICAIKAIQKTLTSKDMNGLLNVAEIGYVRNYIRDRVKPHLGVFNAMAATYCLRRLGKLKSIEQGKIAVMTGSDATQLTPDGTLATGQFTDEFKDQLFIAIFEWKLEHDEDLFTYDLQKSESKLLSSIKDSVLENSDKSQPKKSWDDIDKEEEIEIKERENSLRSEVKEGLDVREAIVKLALSQVGNVDAANRGGDKKYGWKRIKRYYEVVGFKDDKEDKTGATEKASAYPFNPTIAGKPKNAWSWCGIFDLWAIQSILGMKGLAWDQNPAIQEGIFANQDLTVSLPPKGKPRIRKGTLLNIKSVNQHKVLLAEDIPENANNNDTYAAIEGNTYSQGVVYTKFRKVGNIVSYVDIVDLFEKQQKTSASNSSGSSLPVNDSSSHGRLDKKPNSKEKDPAYATIETTKYSGNNYRQISAKLVGSSDRIQRESSAAIDLDPKLFQISPEHVRKWPNILPTATRNDKENIKVILNSEAKPPTSENVSFPLQQKLNEEQTSIIKQIELNRSSIDSKKIQLMMYSGAADKGKQYGYGYQGETPNSPTAVKQNPIPSNDTPEARGEQVKKVVWEELRHEGGTSAINAYDSQIFTWGRGFGGASGTLPSVMKAILKDKDIANAFLEYGITYQNNTFMVVNTFNGAIEVGKNALSLIQIDPKLLAAFVQIAEDPKFSQQVTDAQWSVMLSGAGSVPKEVYNWDDRWIALIAHITHWWPNTGWAGVNYKDKNNIKDILMAWGTKAASKPEDNGAMIVSNKDTIGNFKTWGSGVAWDAIRQVCPVPVLYTKTEAQNLEKQELSGKLLVSTPSGLGYYIFPEMPKPLVNGKLGINAEQPFYYQFYALGGMPTDDILEKLDIVYSIATLKQLLNSYDIFIGDFGAAIKVYLKAVILSKEEVSKKKILKEDRENLLAEAKAEFSESHSKVQAIDKFLSKPFGKKRG